MFKKMKNRLKAMKTTNFQTISRLVEENCSIDVATANIQKYYGLDICRNIDNVEKMRKAVSITCCPMKTWFKPS